MATITQTQLVEDALRAVGHIGPNDTADASDTTYVQRKLTALLERLEEDSATDWDTAGAIPVARTAALQDALVADIAEAYGVQLAPGTMEIAERRLRYMANRPYVSAEDVADY